MQLLCQLLVTRQVEQGLAWDRSVQESSLGCRAELSLGLCSPGDFHPIGTPACAIAAVTCVQAQWAAFTTREEELQVHSSSCNQGMRNMGTTCATKDHGKFASGSGPAILDGSQLADKTLLCVKPEKFANLSRKVPLSLLSCKPCLMSGNDLQNARMQKALSIPPSVLTPLCLSQSSPDHQHQGRGSTNRRHWSKAESSSHFDAGPIHFSPL